MDILKAAMDWAKAEVFSTQFFILFGIVFIAVSIGFWQLGKTDVAKAFVFPTLIAGVLVVIIGAGLYYSNSQRLSSFPGAHEEDPAAFLQAEITRSQETAASYEKIVHRNIPIIILIAALLIMFIDKPLVRAIGVSTIAMMLVIMTIDMNAKARMEAYHAKLLATGIPDGASLTTTGAAGDGVEPAKPEESDDSEPGASQ